MEGNIERGSGSVARKGKWRAEIWVQAKALGFSFVRTELQEGIDFQLMGGIDFIHGEHPAHPHLIDRESAGEAVLC